MPDMIVFTSAKSRLMSPGTRIRSVMPWMACFSTSSAVTKASIMLVLRSRTASRRSFGIVITVSTASRSISSPSSACRWRFLPSNLKGRVTTAMVRAPSSVASDAMTGAAPVPVPPPRPVVTNTMSAPDSAWIRLSVSSSAAWRPTVGSAPAQSPLVSFAPIWILIGAGFERSAWASVLATTNSTPDRPACTMRVTACPAPPTPTP
jgi:hypothetical protein